MEVSISYSCLAWRWRLAVAMTVVVMLLGAAGPPPLAWAQTCKFQSGFKLLHDLLPDIVGECLENEQWVVEGTRQRTTGGLLVWRRADNWTAFTDGYRTWSIGPRGLHQQSNAASFGWQSSADDGGLGFDTVHLPGNERIRIGIHPDGGHVVIYAYNTVTGSYDPVLQLTNVPFQSTGERIGIPYFWNKVFFQSAHQPSVTSYHEFVEFRIGGTFPNQEGRGVGGFLYHSDSDRLTLWAENQRGQAFATQSRSERDLGVGSHDNRLATTRLAIGAGNQYEDVPITVSDAHVVFDASTLEGIASPIISMDNWFSVLTLSGGPSADSGAGLELHGAESAGNPGGVTLTTPDQTGSAAARVEVSSGADAAVTMHAPAIAAGGLSVPEGQYLQIATTDRRVPAAADCDSDEERGRMSVANLPRRFLPGTQSRLYICQGAARGWDYVLLAD